MTHRGPARLAATILAVLTLGTAGIVLARGLAGPEGGGVTTADLAAIRFTVLQAGLSALLSAVLAVPLARALARRRFPGRAALIAALGAPFLVPTITAVLALIAVFGRSGWLAHLTGWEVSPYGLQGVLLAHVFLNLPLCTRMLLNGWAAIPAERWRLAESLGLPPGALFRHLEAPMLRATLPGAALAVFSICLSSFAVALVLGGGPRASTVELSIYQALRYDFDLARAARLSAVQFALTTAALALTLRLTLPAAFGAGRGLVLAIPAPGGWRAAVDGVVILAAALFLLAPLAALTAAGLPAVPDLPAQVWPAAVRSVLIALGSAVLALMLAVPLALAAARGTRWAELSGTLPLAASALVMGTGLFLMLRPALPPGVLALPVTLLVNATLATPFAFRILAPPARILQADYGQLAASLGLEGWAALRLLILPRLARPLGFAAGLTAALSMGDLSVIALFAVDDAATLPLLVSRLAGSYRSDAAAAAALLLVALAFALYLILDRSIARHDPDT